MSEQQNKSNLRLLIILVTIFAMVIIWVVAKRQSVNRTFTVHQPHEHKSSLLDKVKDTNQPTISLSEIIAARKYWGPILTSWFGKMTPDFTLTDINGKEHKLSDYRGKNVMLVFWATWCGPCITEIPHLIALQNVLGEDKLVILAVSHIAPNNTTEMVRNFTKHHKLNYTVISTDIGTMPSPFINIRGIPSSFFINPEGKIKLATEGTLSFGEMKAIVLAKNP